MFPKDHSQKNNFRTTNFGNLCEQRQSRHCVDFANVSRGRVRNHIFVCDYLNIVPIVTIETVCFSKKGAKELPKLVIFR